VADAFAAADRHATLGWLAPGGLLELPIEGGPVRALRIEVPEGPLSLETIAIDGPTPQQLATARLRASGADREAPLGPQPLAVVATGSPAWLEIAFPGPVPVTRLRLRTGADGARGLTVDARGRWRQRRVYDGRAEVRAWRRELEAARSAVRSDGPAETLLEVLDLTVRGRYERAHAMFISRITDDGERRAFSRAVNRALLPPREVEWTTHGARRSFRYWSEDEQVAYVTESARIVEALRPLTPNVCFGFGSVLATVRDHALIPHDDDLDITIAFEPSEAPTIADGLARVEDWLRAAGYTVTGAFYAHRHVHLPVGHPVDGFVGIFEGDVVSWYPAARGGLARTDVFPPSSATLLGVEMAIPASPEAYLERLYGAGWRTPDPDFMHPWYRSEFADLSGR
jgi:hypothetical protein